MALIKKLIFVPIGLPGLGKSTLSRHLEQTTNKFFHQGKTAINVDYRRINYDQMLTDNLKDYQSKHPDVPFHEVIDIIRPWADQQYLDTISNHCAEEVSGPEDKENQ